MPTAYLINERIQFRPDLNQLISNNNNKQKYSIPAPASRCLLLLITARVLVTQSQLFSYVWGEQGEEVTPNNLYQNISLLRKAFRNLTDTDNNWIITIPRKGFKIDNNVIIEEIEIVDSEEHLTLKGQTNGTVNLLDLYKSTLRKKISFGIYVITFLVFLSTIPFLYKVIDSSHSIADQFVFNAKIDHCQLYINNDMGETKNQQKILSILQPNCKKFPHVYITAYSIMHTATLIACEKPISRSRAHCVSMLLRGYKL
jgi:DNA-binding winged helix-turn-helix (wHTH) protein